MSNEMGERQLVEWQGDFGNDYIERNLVTEKRIRERVVTFAQIWREMDGNPPSSVLEIGSNVGLNLRALKAITEADLFAVEPNKKAFEILIEDGVVEKKRAFNTSGADIPLADGSVDLCFSSVVLIHVPDETLTATLSEMYRVARKYILCIEYFAPETVTKSYRGHDDLLFKRDYGSIWMDNFPSLRYVADGFFWKRMTGLDNVNWWLFAKE